MKKQNIKRHITAKLYLHYKNKNVQFLLRAYAVLTKCLYGVCVCVINIYAHTTSGPKVFGQRRFSYFCLYTPLRRIGIEAITV